MSQAGYAPGVEGLLAPLQPFLTDKSVSEILINRPQEVFVEQHGLMQRIEQPALTSQYLRRLFLLIANTNRQVLSDKTPLLAGHLPNGSRVQLVMPEASRYETLAIRQFTHSHVTFDEYEAQGFFQTDSSQAVASDEAVLKQYYAERNWRFFLTEAILKKKNIVISGATSSGKTTFLNSCLQLIPADERLITLEDTYEINISHPNIVRLKALKTVGQQESIVTMQDLVQASLRLRPDRLIMGEIRGKEIADFVAACSTGHQGALATIHATTPTMAFMRMAQLYKLNNVAGMSEHDIYQLLHAVIDVVVQLEKTPLGRKIVEVYYQPAC